VAPVTPVNSSSINPSGLGSAAPFTDSGLGPAPGLDFRSDHPPVLSIIVVSFNGERLLTRCLESLGIEAGPHDAEILVVADGDHPGGRPSDRLASTFSQVRWIDAPGGCTVPRMRALGIAASRGNIVALLEDDCVVQAGWCKAVLGAHRADGGAVGGPVEPGLYRRALDWAVYFCDYGRFMLPLGDGRAFALPGNNLSFTQAAFARLPAEAAHEFFEVFAHDAWQRECVPTRLEPAALVRNVNAWTLAHVTWIPYHHGRAFAGRRVAGQPLWRRARMGLLAAALPALKVSRVVREVVSRRRLIGPMLYALPWIVVLSTCWSLGESVGYLAGPGASPSKWR
jgi:glycosyltransferase involved in cell wall biosynthesis